MSSQGSYMVRANRNYAEEDESIKRLESVGDSMLEIQKGSKESTSTDIDIKNLKNMNATEIEQAKGKEINFDEESNVTIENGDTVIEQ